MKEYARREVAKKCSMKVCKENKKKLRPLALKEFLMIRIDLLTVSTMRFLVLI